MIGFWVTDAEKAALQKEAKKRGYSNLAEFLRAIAKGVVKIGIISFIFRWLALGSDPATAAVGGLSDAGTVAYYLGYAAFFVGSEIVKAVC